MSYPRLEIDLEKLYHNTDKLVNECRQKGIEVAAVTKVFCGNPKIAQIIAHGGVGMLADSRILNLKKMKDIPVPKMLLRIPMISELEDLVKYSDISINSEIEVIKRISKVALNHGKIHNILLMIDMGDLREGLWEDEIIPTVGEIVELKGVKLSGLAVNFGCYGGIIPEEHTLEKFVAFKNQIESTYNISIELLSGGNSNSLHLVWENKIPEGINHIRLGEPIVLGKEDVYKTVRDGLYGDGFRLFGEVVEIREKPTIPIGKRGIDAFGDTPVFEDRGMRRRIIVAIGRQDMRLEGISPKDLGVTIIGASSDHLILDITDSSRQFEIGSIVELEMNYSALLAAMTSEYVHKVFI